MFKLLGMFFFVLLLFFVVFALLIVFKVRSTLRTILNGNRQFQEDYQSPYRHAGKTEDAGGMVIDVEAEHKPDTTHTNTRGLS